MDKISLDEIDRKILEHLSVNGRMTWSELADKLKLSSPGAADRVRRLEEKKIISSYAAILSPDLLGYRLCAYIAVTLEKHENRGPFMKQIKQVPEVQECHYITGPHDFLLKVRCRDTQDLNRLVNFEIKGLIGVWKTETNIVMETVKETPAIPLAAVVGTTGLEPATSTMSR
jgi:Lrp/AsnC family leucine-responsive transcriptional regulator